MKIKKVGFETLGICPAAVWMHDGTIEINTSVWHHYSPFQRKFILYHELGHYNLQTDSELEADAYALRHMYKTSYKSLKRCITSLYKIGYIDTERMLNLYKKALQIDLNENNNTKAKQELDLMRRKEINPYNTPEEYEEKNYATDSEFCFPDLFKSRAIGFYIGDSFIDVKEILLVSIFIVLLCILRKIK